MFMLMSSFFYIQYFQNIGMASEKDLVLNNVSWLC